MRILVTGSAGFIGFHLARRFLEQGHEVVGLDGFTAYYDVNLKYARHALLQQYPRFSFHRLMLETPGALEPVFAGAPFDLVLHLAAQAGVRYSLENPRAYVDANLIGTFNLMEMLRQHPAGHFMLASTSSIYGANPKVPFAETDMADQPLTLYAATKKSTELMAHSYAHLWNQPTTAFRFFTVYGPWGRPDMAMFKFTRGVIDGTPIDIYNHGEMSRDFTFIDDLVEAVARLSALAPVAGGRGASPVAPYRTINLGGGTPVSLMGFIEAVEAAVGRPALRNYMEMQKGDVPKTFASADMLEQLTGYKPGTPVTIGVPKFVEWYRGFYGV